MSSLVTPPLFAALRKARRVLIAGAGGGFDVYAGLPLAIALWDADVEVYLANLSFSQLELLDLDVWLAENVAAVTPQTTGLDDYFPERTLAAWLAGHDLASTVYAFPQVGVQRLRAAYRHLVDHLGIDAIVLVDGGTDILMRGDEAGLGTPVEDMTSLAAVADAQAATPLRPSIVNGQIAAATRGDFGDVQFTRRTHGSALFVNPLMAIYFTVDLDALAARSLYLDQLENTYGMRQVVTRIEQFRAATSTRLPRAFPH